MVIGDKKMNKDINKIKFATFKEQTPTTYCLSKAITKHIKKEDFAYYCDFFGLDFDCEAQRIQKKLRAKFSWYGEKVKFD